jgi:hypothetical protein
MSGWIVGHVPAWLLLIGLIALIAGGAVLVQAYVRRRFPALTGDEHNDVTKFTYGFIGFVYAFFIGFVVSSMWGQNNTADGNARAEGAAAVQMARDAVVFDTADGDRIRQSLLAYEQAAVAEWSQAGISRSPEADTALARLYTAYEQVKAKTDTQRRSSRRPSPTSTRSVRHPASTPSTLTSSPCPFSDGPAGRPGGSRQFSLRAGHKPTRHRHGLRV